MWTRRLLLATMVAVAAMSLPRHGSETWNVSMVSSDAGFSAQR